MSFNAQLIDLLKSDRRSFDNDVFAAPKPERLIQRILHVGANEGDKALNQAFYEELP